MEAAQQRTGWPIGRKKRRESGGHLGATPENTGMLGQTEATCSKESWFALQLHAKQPPPRVKQQKGKGKQKATPRQRGYHQECNGTAGPGTKLVKASRQASKRPRQREAAPKQAGKGVRTREAGRRGQEDREARGHMAQ